MTTPLMKPITHHCNICGKNTEHIFRDIQHWATKNNPNAADSYLFDCPICRDTISVSDEALTAIYSAQQRAAWDAASAMSAEETKALLDRFSRSMYQIVSNVGKDTPRSRWESGKVKVSSEGAKVLAARRK